MANYKTWDDYLATLSPEAREEIDLTYAMTLVMTDENDAEDEALFGADLKRVLELLHKYGKTLAIVPWKESQNV